MKLVTEYAAFRSRIEDGDHAGVDGKGQHIRLGQPLVDRVPRSAAVVRVERAAVRSSGVGGGRRNRIGRDRQNIGVAEAGVDRAPGRAAVGALEGSGSNRPRVQHAGDTQREGAHID